MLTKKQFLLIEPLLLITFLTTAHVYPQKQTGANAGFSCDKYIFSTSIFDVIHTQGKSDLVKSELWNEYEPNQSFRAVPDSIHLSTYLENELITLADNPKAFAKGEPDIYCTVTLQIKISTDLDCTNPKNPRLTREYVVINKKRIRSSEFVEGDRTLGQYYVSIGANFPIRQKIKENGGFLVNVPRQSATTWFVNQLIVRTYLSSSPVSVHKTSAKCYVEYIHPVCAKVEVPTFNRTY